MKLTRELEGRKRLDEINFQKAGTGPLVKTYKYDPTKPRPSRVEKKVVWICTQAIRLICMKVDREKKQIKF